MSIQKKIAKYLEKCAELLKPQKTRGKKIMVVPITHIGVWRLARNATLNPCILGTFLKIVLLIVIIGIPCM